jgi:RNA polymerase sigma-70 factor (ECF subfamily)
MAFRPSSPEPDDPGEMKDFRDPEEAGEASRLPEPPEEGPELVPEEDWEAEGAADETLADASLEDAENEEVSPQLTDPNGVSRDMATAALNTGVLQGRPAEGVSRAVAGPADWRAMSDADIMLRVREGDDTGFSFLIEKYRKPIINFMYRMVHNQAVAEELAQEVFLRVYRSRQTYRAEAKFTTWLYRIATNLGVNHARDTKYERSAQTVYLDQPDPETGTTPDVADAHATAEEELVRDERMRAIRKHVMALPERQRNAVLMHKYQGLDYREIGAVLKLSESATKSLLFRAYQTLRERLKEFVEQD